MTYRPSDHVPTGRRLLAAWIVCLGIAAAGLGTSFLRHEAKALMQHAHAERAALHFQA